jgi:hypothetical protein
VLDLIVQAAQDVPLRPGVVVLDEVGVDSQFGQRSPVPALEEEAALVAEDLGFEEDDVRNRGGDGLHPRTSYLSRFCRYWP